MHGPLQVLRKWQLVVLSFYSESILVNVKLSSLLRLTFQAIENFAVTLKTTAQMLQMFGACLATTELPRGVLSTEDLLMSHTGQRDKLQVSGQWPWREPGAELKAKSSSSPFSGDLAAVDHLKSSR